MSEYQCVTEECFNTTITGVSDKIAGMNGAYDVFWVLLSMVLVFFMQSGFAMLEVGTVRSKNVANILFKNAFDPILAGVIWWICGWGFALGVDSEGRNAGNVNGFIGNGDFFLVSDGNKMTDYHLFIFQWAFCATAATIVSGAIAERCYISAYFIYSAALCGFIYPCVVHWVWSSEGWLSAFNPDFKRVNHGLIDFAGSGVVHMTGGFAALAGALIIGPRSGWVENQVAIAAATSKEERRTLELQFAPHDRTMMTFGTLILWFGWFGFNCGSTLGLSGGFGAVAGKVGVTTVLGAAGGAVSTLIITTLMDEERRMLLDPVFNGILGGLVSITAGCSVVEPYAALIIGMIGGAVYVFSAKLVARLGVDDVLQASAVHGFCGAWGLLAVGFFATKSDLVAAYGPDASMLEDMSGAFYDGNGKQFGTQLLAIVIIFAWAFGMSAIMFMILKKLGMLRIPEWVEDVGIDRVEHGASAFQRRASVWGGSPRASMEAMSEHEEMAGKEPVEH